MPYSGEKACLGRNGIGELSVVEINADRPQGPKFRPDIFSIEVVFIPKSITVTQTVRHNNKEMFCFAFLIDRWFLGCRRGERCNERR